MEDDFPIGKLKENIASNSKCEPSRQWSYLIYILVTKAFSGSHAMEMVA